MKQIDYEGEIILLDEICLPFIFRQTIGPTPSILNYDLDSVPISHIIQYARNKTFNPFDDCSWLLTDLDGRTEQIVIIMRKYYEMNLM